MAHFAKIEHGVVTNVIVAEQAFINGLPDKDTWVQTSYNTHGGVHTNGGTPLRKNFAGLGYTYDSQRDAFYAPKPYNSWLLDETSCTWKAPVDMPTEGRYTWNEETLSWVEVPQ